jgi:O-antigen ligase
MSDGYPRYRSHFLPRSRAGWVAASLFLALLALAQPPFVHAFVNRTEPWILGLPFLYAWLLFVYVTLIGVLLWALRRGV